MTLPPAYADLAKEGGPRHLLIALKLLGTLEVPGKGSNPTIEAWADEVAKADPTGYNRWAAGWYSNDGIAWCGLFMAVVMVRANLEKREARNPPDKYLAALSWAKWGQPQFKAGAMLGDVLTFVRNGGGHVGIYVGEDAGAFHVLGGNQSDKVSIARIEKLRLHAVTRPPYLATPANVRKIARGATGALSTNEA